MTSCSFEQALAALKKGAKIRRDEWGDGVMIFLDKRPYSTPAIMGQGPEGRIHYTPTTADLLATDWEIL